MKEINWKGVFPALTTKFHADGDLDLDGFGHNLQAQLEAGVHGIVLGGTLGESSVLEADEKRALLVHALKIVNGRVPVLLNIAEGSTKVAVRMAQEAEENGADGLMVLPPMRYKPDEKECIAWFRSIAAATPLPIMVYNNPIDYKTEITLAVFDALAEIPSIQAVKESTRDVSNVTRMINRFGGRFAILCGVDTLALEELLMGACGWVAGLGCAFPKETMAIFNLVQAGRLEEARAIYRWFLPLLELDIHPKLVQYIKLAEAETGLGTVHVRAPRMVLEGSELESVLAIIRNGLENRPELPIV